MKRHIARWILGWLVCFGHIIPLSAQNTLAGGACNVTIKLTAHTTLTKTITIGTSNSLEVDLNGYVLTKVNGGRLFNVENGKTLFIKDSNPNTSNTGNWGLDGESVTISGGVMTGGVANYGGAIIVQSGGKVEFLGGTIAGCKAKCVDDSKRGLPNGCGGAVYVKNGGNMKISGGNIMYCQTTDVIKDDGKVYIYFGGGAVYVDGGGKDDTMDFIFEDGIISHCQASNGGGVFVRKSDFQMKGDAVISNCNAVYSPTPTGNGLGGGGVYIYNGKMVMEGNTFITENKSGRQGQGVHVEGTDAVFVMNGGTISKNVPYRWNGTDFSHYHDKRDLGGGVFVNAAEFYMNNGFITNNVSSSGGGVMLNTTGVYFEMNGGIISDNWANGKTLGNGGGVYLYHGTFVMNNGSLSRNKARRYGGAMNLNAGAKLELNGNCLFDSNEAGSGGGISQEYGDCSISLNQEGIRICNNKAIGTGSLGSGGGILVNRGTMRIISGIVENNEAENYGGGIALMIRDKTGDLTVEMTGGEILNNKGGQGGGIGIYANKVPTTDDNFNGENGINDVVVNLKGGTFQGNSAAIGGAMHVGVNPANSTASMYIGTTTTSPDILQNTATQHGGGLAMDNGSIEIINGNLTSNSATENGGAVYIQNGNFDISGEASIVSNSAKNGGGFCVEDGEVRISKGTISQNTATDLGGGLYVTSTSSDETPITFNGGNFIQNSAFAGGGVAVVGNNKNITLTMNGNIQGNNATNGGGIYLKEGKMNFTQGLISSNQAIQTSALSGNTAYNKDVTAVNGIGGGVYLDNNTELHFPNATQMGLFDNIADNGADDIFASGTNTIIDLPNVASMNLTGLGSAGELFWVEDYITNDIGYDYGTKINTPLDGTNLRYRDAFQRGVLTYPVAAQKLENIYTCLALGHEIIYVTLIKEGLQLGESAVFTFQMKGDDSVHQLLLTGTAENVVSKRIALAAGEWTVTEKDWSWTYETQAPSSITQDIISNREFKFINSKKTALPLHDEENVENTMSGPQN